MEYIESAKIVWFGLYWNASCMTHSKWLVKTARILWILWVYSSRIAQSYRNARVQNEFVNIIRFLKEKNHYKSERGGSSKTNNISIQLIRICLVCWKIYETIAMWDENITEYKFPSVNAVPLPALVAEGFLWVHLKIKTSLCSAKKLCTLC